MKKYTIAVIVGSLRRDSFNRKLATAMDKAEYGYTDTPGN